MVQSTHEKGETKQDGWSSAEAADAIQKREQTHTQMWNNALRANMADTD